MSFSARARALYPRIFSGIQPTGIPHLGNYLGAIRNWVALQENADQVLYCVVDLHSLTVPQDASRLRANIRDMAISLLACGVNPDKSILFQQSKVSYHAELAWLLSCRTPLGWLRRMTQWKTKKNQQSECLGLLSYPVLMAADVLLYKTTHVPVGSDQVQHLELARDVANLFNSAFDDNSFFPEPEPIVGEHSRVMSLRDPTSKMSKSDLSDLSRIELTDTDDVIRKKIRKAVTDGVSEITYDPLTRPGVSNLVSIYGGLTGMSNDDVIRRFAGKDTEAMKSDVTDCVIEYLSPLRKRIRELRLDEKYVDETLDRGCEAAREIARENFDNIRKLLGLT